MPNLQYFVRVGALAELHLASALVPMQPGQKVVLRGPQGLQWGVVSGPPVRQESGPPVRQESGEGTSDSPDLQTQGSGDKPNRDPQSPAQNHDATESGYKILRPTLAADEALMERLERGKREAIESCRLLLAEVGSSSTLLDIDQTLSGEILVMHFLGPVDKQAETLTQRLARRYQEVVQTEQLASAATAKCGSDTCGTGGCGSDTCGTGGCGSGGCGSGGCGDPCTTV